MTESATTDAVARHYDSRALFYFTFAEAGDVRTLRGRGRSAGMTDVPGEGFVPFPETPKLVDAHIAAHPSGGRDCLLATTEDGQRLAFGFEAEGDRPGLQIVDPHLWLEAAEEPADSPRVFDSIEEINADDWLQAVVTNPVGKEWLEQIKAAHPAAFETWFSQRQYETGGEQGSGGAL